MGIRFFLLQLCRWNPHARVAHGKGQTPVIASRKLDGDLAVVGELDRVRQEVLEHLLQPLGIGLDLLGRIGPGGHLERQPLVGGGSVELRAQLFERRPDAEAARLLSPEEFDKLEGARRYAPPPASLTPKEAEQLQLNFNRNINSTPAGKGNDPRTNPNAPGGKKPPAKGDRGRDGDRDRD